MPHRPVRASSRRPPAHLPHRLLHPQPAPTRTRVPSQGRRSLGLAAPSFPTDAWAGLGPQDDPLEGWPWRALRGAVRTPGAESRFGTPRLPTPLRELLGGDSTQVAAWASPCAHACVSPVWGPFTRAGLLGPSPSLCPRESGNHCAFLALLWATRDTRAAASLLCLGISLLFLGELMHSIGINCEPGFTAGNPHRGRRVAGGRHPGRGPELMAASLQHLSAGVWRWARWGQRSGTSNGLCSLSFLLWAGGDWQRRERAREVICVKRF